MTDTGRSSIPRHVHDAAGEWLVRRRDSTDPAVETEFAAWLEADARHRLAYDQVSSDWRDSVQLADTAVGRTRKLVRAPFLMRHSTHVGAVSLGVAAVLGLSTIEVVRHAGPFEFVSPAEAATFQTAVGEIRAIRLEDGSTLTLDTSSSVRVRFTRAARRIDLTKGRVRFRVATDARSFTVVVPGGEIVARRTLFDVSVIGTQPVVSAIEGEVELHSAIQADSGTSKLLIAGEQMTLGSDAGSHPLSRGDARWVSGMLALDRTPLGTAVAAINRYNRTQVRLGEPRLAGLAVTGAFRARDPRQFAGAIATMFGLVIDQSRPDFLVLQPWRQESSHTRK